MFCCYSILHSALESVGRRVSDFTFSNSEIEVGLMLTPFSDNHSKAIPEELHHHRSLDEQDKFQRNRDHTQLSVAKRIREHVIKPIRNCKSSVAEQSCPLPNAVLLYGDTSGKKFTMYFLSDILFMPCPADT